MKKITPAVSIIWISLIVLSFFWNYSNSKRELENIAFSTARIFFDQIVLTRAWNAFHGGVYVPVTEKTLPNPYLETPLREIQISNDLTLTKINPAFMTRQIAEIASEAKGIQFHITSLTPIRPGNNPNERERKSLISFEKGLREFGEFLGKGNEMSFFYMAPLITSKPCLACHAKQGYKEGDIRGGISVTLPLNFKIPLLAIITGHIAIGLAGFIGILMFGLRLDKAYATIRKQARVDELTGIGNRRSFSETMHTEVRQSRREKYPLSIIMGDIDYFKKYNDTYGHKMGDTCLKNIAETINETLMRPGDFCFRYGGEEFIVILSNTNLTGALHVAEKIRNNIVKLKLPHKGSPDAGIVSISLGVATADENSEISGEEIVHRADMSLYAAKHKGRNRVEPFTDDLSDAYKKII